MEKREGLVRGKRGGLHFILGIDELDVSSHGLFDRIENPALRDRRNLEPACSLSQLLDGLKNRETSELKLSASA